MPVLAFQIQADYDKVIRLREEIQKLKAEMSNMDAVNSPHQFNVLNQKLKQCTVEYNNITEAAVKAGAKIETGFKKKIFDAQQAVNDFTEKIIAQRSVVKGIEGDVNRLGEAYRKATKSWDTTKANSLLKDYNQAKTVLNEEKGALFELTQERAKAQLGVKKLREEYQLFAKDSGASSSILAKMKSEIMGLGAGMLAGFGLKELGAEIVRVRGQFQQADTAIQTLLGSKERADELLSKVRQYAKISPLEFGDITKATQMMLGFNIEAEKVPGFIKAIGDVSMGESGRFNSLTLAFSQMSATGKLMGQDLLQMINAGFNPLTVMAEKTGKSVAQLKEEMSKGAISAEMVQQAFIDATSAGGKFYNMSENAAKTINGQLSMMHDALDAAMNDVGKASEGVIVGAISGVTKLIENYETVGRVLMGLVTTYGTYRTAVALVTYAENGHTLAMTLARAQILLTQKAQALLNATMLANPYVLAAVALGGLVGTLIATSDGMNASERAQKDFNAAIDEGTQKQQEYNAEVEKAISTANNDTAATKDRRDAMNLLIQRYPEIIQKYIDEEGHLKNILQLKREIAAIDGQRTYDNLKNTAQRYKDAAEAARLLINGKKLTDEQQKLLDEVKQEYFDKNNWQAKALFKNSDLLDYTEQMSKDYKNQADRTNTENNIKKYQETITKFSKDRLTKLQTILQTAKTKGNRVALPNVAGLSGLVLNQADIANLDTYVGGLLKAKDDTVTKKTLSDRKKKLQAELDALSYEAAAGKKGADLKKKIEEIDKKLNVYSTSKKGGSKTNTEEQTESISRQQKLAQARAAKDLEFSTREAEIKAMKEGMAKRLAQIELNKDKEMEAISRSYEDLRINRINEAKKLWDADPKNKGKNFYDSEAYKFASAEDRYTAGEKTNKAEREKAVQAEYVDSITKLTDEYQTAIDQRAEKYKKYNDDIAAMTDLRNKAEMAGNAEAVRGLEERIRLAQMLRDLSVFDEGEENYALKYGTWSEKLQATNSKYERMIAKANAEKNTGLAKSLQKEWEEAVSELDIDKLKEQINWDVVFGNMTSVSKKKLKEVKKQMDKFLTSPQFKKMTPENQKVLTDAFSKIREQLSERGGIFEGLIESTRNYTTALEELEEATNKYNEAVQKFGEDSKEAQDALKVKNAAERNKIQNEDDMNKSLNSTINKVRTISNMAKTMANAGNDAVGAMGSVFETLAVMLGDKGGWASIIAGILEILSSIGTEGISNFVGGLWTGVSNALYGINEWNPFAHIFEDGTVLGDFFNANLIKPADYKAYNEMKAKYESLIPVWEQLIDAKKKYIAMSYGAEAVFAEKEAERIVQREIDAYRSLGKERLNAGVSVGSHSIGVRTREDMNDSDWRKVAASLGRSTDNWAGLGGRLEGLFDLTTEKLEKLRNDAPEFWAKLDTEVREYLDNIIEGASKIESIQDKLNEKMTSTTFDALKNSFADALYDMEGTAEERGKKIKDALFKSIVDNYILGKDFDNWLDGFYKKWAEKIGAQSMSSYDWSEYTKEYNEMLEKKIAERDKWAASVGYTGKSGSSDQTTTVSMAEKATYDQFETFLGIATAQQIAQEHIKDMISGITGDGLSLTNMNLEQMISLTASQYDIVNDSRDLLAKSYLELQEANEHLGKIEKSVDTINNNVSETRRIINDRL